MRFLLCLLFVLGPVAFAQETPSSGEELKSVAVEAMTVVEFHAAAQILSVDGALPLDVIDGLAASEHLAHLTVEPGGAGLVLHVQFEFRGMDAFRSWYDAAPTKALLQRLKELDTGVAPEYSLSVKRL